MQHESNKKCLDNSIVVDTSRRLSVPDIARVPKGRSNPFFISQASCLH
jgi:hypothetical protein